MDKKKKTKEERKSERFEAVKIIRESLKEKVRLEEIELDKLN